MKQKNIQAEYWNKVSKKIANLKMTGPAERELKDFFEFINIENNKLKILDVGCGAGRVSLPLLRMGHTVVATEIADRNLQELQNLALQEKLSKNLKLINTDFLRPITESNFDLAICCNVIHHFDPSKKDLIIANMVNSIRKGGSLAIIEPNPYHLLYYLWYFAKEISGQDRGRWEVEKGFLNSSEKSLKEVLTRAGLKNFSVKWYAFFPSRLALFFPSIVKINKKIQALPLLNKMSCFLWIKAEK